MAAVRACAVVRRSDVSHLAVQLGFQRRQHCHARFSRGMFQQWPLQSSHWRLHVLCGLHGPVLLARCAFGVEPRRVESVSPVCCCASAPAVACPNECSGNGRCMSVAALSTEFGPDVTSPASTGDGSGVAYTNWDANTAYGCFCDWGYFGSDCSLRKSC